MTPVAFFDADGVFLRTLHPGNYFEHRYRLSKEDLTGFRLAMDLCLVGKADLVDELARFLPGWGIRESARDAITEAFSTGNEIDPAVDHAVQALRARGITCGLVTNQDRHRMAYLDDRLAIRGHFDAVFVSCEMGAKKPDPEFYHAISAQYLGRTLLFWDDRPENVAAAAACGWKSFVFTDAGSLLRDFHGLA